MLSMLRVHRALFLLIPLLMLIPETMAAENQVYLLNCRLMDRASLVYKRYCNGELGAQRQFCPDRRCIRPIAVRVITNFHSVYDVQKGGASSGTSNTAPSTRGVTDRVGTSSVSDGALSATGGVASQIGSAASSTSNVVGGVTSGVTGAVSGALGTLGGLQ